MLDYESDDFNLDGDILDDILIDEFGLSPKYIHYWVVRDATIIATNSEILIPYEDTIKIYCEQNEKEESYDQIMQGINRFLSTSKKRLIKNGNCQNVFNILCNRYKAKLKKEKAKQK